MVILSRTENCFLFLPDVATRYTGWRAGDGQLIDSREAQQFCLVQSVLTDGLRWFR